MEQLSSQAASGDLWDSLLLRCFCAHGFAWDASYAELHPWHSETRRLGGDMVMALQSTLPDVPHTCWGKYGSNMTTFFKPILRVWHRAVLEMCLWVFDSCMTRSISKESVGRSVKPAPQLYFYAACWDDVVDYEMRSSSKIQLGKPGLGSCEFSETFTYGHYQKYPKVLSSTNSIHTHSFAACPRGGLFFVSFANLLAPDGWRRFARQKHYSVGGHDNDQPTLSVSNANAKDGTPNIYRDDAGHDGHIYIEIYWVHSSKHLFSPPLGEEDPYCNLTNFFWKRLMAPRIMARPNCRLSSFLCKNWEDFISSPQTLPSASCNVLASASWRFPNLKKVGSNNRSQWEVWLEVTTDQGAPQMMIQDLSGSHLSKSGR